MAPAAVLLLCHCYSRSCGYGEPLQGPGHCHRWSNRSGAMGHPKSLTRTSASFQSEPWVAARSLSPSPTRLLAFCPPWDTVALAASSPAPFAVLVAALRIRAWSFSRTTSYSTTRTGIPEGVGVGGVHGPHGVGWSWYSPSPQQPPGPTGHPCSQAALQEPGGPWAQDSGLWASAAQTSTLFIGLPGCTGQQLGQTWDHLAPTQNWEGPQAAPHRPSPGVRHR